MVNKRRMDDISHVLLFLLLVGCVPEKETEEPEIGVVIPPECTEAARNFMVDLCAAANPHSDEEPEDMIAAAWMATVALYGKSAPGTELRFNYPNVPGYKAQVFIADDSGAEPGGAQ